MEDQAPYHAAPPANLAQPLGEWLRGQGFTLEAQAFPTLTVLTAHWLSPEGHGHFQLTYTWQAGPVADATCQLVVCTHQPSLRLDTLFSAQRVRVLADAQRLLTGCVRYCNARLLAQPVPAS